MNPEQTRYHGQFVPSHTQGNEPNLALTPQNTVQQGNIQFGPSHGGSMIQPIEYGGFSNYQVPHFPVNSEGGSYTQYGVPNHQSQSFPQHTASLLQTYPTFGQPFTQNIQQGPTLLTSATRDNHSRPNPFRTLVEGKFTERHSKPAYVSDSDDEFPPKPKVNSKAKFNADDSDSDNGRGVGFTSSTRKSSKQKTAENSDSDSPEEAKYESDDDRLTRTKTLSGSQKREPTNTKPGNAVKNCAASKSKSGKGFDVKLNELINLNEKHFARVLKEVPEGHSDGLMIAKYIANTFYGNNVPKLHGLYEYIGNTKTNRNNLPRTPDDYRMLLWHRTFKNKADIGEVLQKGLQVRSENRYFTGTLVFYDRYPQEGIKYAKGDREVYILCEVSFNRKTEHKSPHDHKFWGINVLPTGMESVKTIGEYQPEWKANISWNGMSVPLGISKPDGRYPNYNTKINEYTIFDATKVQICFLADIQF